MRKTVCLLAVSLVCVLFHAGCSVRSLEQKPQEPQTVNGQETAEDSAEQPNGLVLQKTGKLDIYTLDLVYLDNSVVEHRYFPVPRTIEGNLTAEMLNELIQDTQPWEIGRILELTQQGEQVFVRMAMKDEIGSASQNELLSIVTTTILHNCADVSSVHFLDESGEGLYLPTQPKQAQEGYEPYSLILPEQSMEELAAVRASVSLDDVRTKIAQEEEANYQKYLEDGGDPQNYSWEKVCLIPNDEKAKQIDAYLNQICLNNIPTTNFSSIEEAPNDFLLFAGLHATPIVMCYSEETAEEGRMEPYYQQLLPISELVHDNSMTLQEHLEENVRELFGPNAVVKHNAADAQKMSYRYHEYAGVYTPPHMGWYPNECYLLEYEHNGDTITATAVFNENYALQDNHAMSEEEYETFLRTQEQKHQFTLKEQDGRVFLTGYTKLEATS